MTFNVTTKKSGSYSISCEDVLAGLSDEAILKLARAKRAINLQDAMRTKDGLTAEQAVEYMLKEHNLTATSGAAQPRGEKFMFNGELLSKSEIAKRILKNIENYTD